MRNKGILGVLTCYIIWGVLPVYWRSLAAVDSLYVSPDGIYLDTTLYGPKPEETVSQVESFPYLVLRTERREESVIFE